MLNTKPQEGKEGGREVEDHEAVKAKNTLLCGSKMETIAVKTLGIEKNQEELLGHVSHRPNLLKDIPGTP